jgi:hypothetical protein
MKLHQFLAKWHHPHGKATPEIEEFNVELIPSGSSYDPRRPTSELRLHVTCAVDIGILPRIRESLRSNDLQMRSADQVIEELFDELDRQLSHRFREVKRRWPLHPEMNKPVLTIVTGAGFSAGFGLPVTAGFRDLVAQPCDDPRSHLQSLFRYELDTYPLKDFFDRRIPDFEYFLTVWEGYRHQLHSIDGRQEGSQRECHRYLLQHICCHLYRLSWKCPRSYGKRFCAFAKWLKRAKESYDVRFVTFNYDVVLEMLCRNAGFEFAYLQRDDPDVIPIRKLHGSINWQSYPGEAKCQTAEMDLLHKSQRECIYAFPDVTACPYGASGEMPVLVPPTARKEYGSIHEWMWALAGDDLGSADKVLVVGYSFPPLDAFATAHLTRVLRNSGTPLTYVLPKGPALDHVRELLRNRGVVGATFISDNWRLRHFEQVL